MNPGSPVVTDTPERIYVPLDAALITPSDTNPLAAVKATGKDQNGVSFFAVTAGTAGNSISVVEATGPSGIAVVGSVITATLPFASTAASDSFTFGSTIVKMTSAVSGSGGNGVTVSFVKPLSTTTTTLGVVVTSPNHVTVNLAVDGSTDTLAALTTALTGANNDLVYTSKLLGDYGNLVTVTYVASTSAKTTTTAFARNRDITVNLAASAATSALTTALTGTNNDLVFTSKLTGSALGNLTSITYRDPAANNAILSISFLGDDIIVNLATGSGGAITSTASLIKAALDASSASGVITTANAGGNDGSGVVTALAKTNLTGGGVLTITSTATQVKAAVDGSASASALVSVANAASNDGTGIVTALAKTSLTGGAWASVTSTAAQVNTAIAANADAAAIVVGSVTSGATTQVVSENTFTLASGVDSNVRARDLVSLINKDASAAALIFAYINPKDEGTVIAQSSTTNLAGGLAGQWALSQHFARGFEVGVAGNVSFKTFNGASVTRTYVDGEREEIAIQGINATSTTATGIMGLP